MKLTTVKEKYTCILHFKGSSIYSVGLSIGVQHFTVATCDNRKEATWWRNHLAKALHRMIEEIEK